MLRLAIAPALVLLALAGCGGDSETGCTAAGCSSGAYVELSDLPDKPVRVKVCVGGKCATQRINAGVGFGEVEVELPGDRARVTVEVRSGRRMLMRRTAEIPVKEFAPNGRECGPICRIAQAKLDLGTGRLEPA
jgi:hypothetical protein